MVVRTLTLKEIVITEKLIDKDTFSNLELRARQLGKPIEQVLIDSDIIPKQKFLQVLSSKWNIKAVDLNTLEIDEDAARLVPEPTARRYFMLPFAKAETDLFVAMSRPWDFTAIEDMHLRTGYHIKPYLAMPDDITNNLNRIFSADSKITDYISAMTSPDQISAETDIKETSSSKKREEISFQSVTETDEKEAKRLVNAVILEGLSRKASDIHIEPFESSLLIRYRIDGQLVKSSFNVHKHLGNALLARIKIMTHSMDITEKRLPQDGRVQITFQKKPIEFRVNTIPTAYGESCVMRILDRTSIKVDLPKLGFLEDTLDKLKEILKKPYGIILVCGPTGSGKSTTLYSALNYILVQSKINLEGKERDVTPKKILTAEDPVEYDLGEVIQLQINPEIGLTFAEAMKAFLRQDPDIIMVGEVRDRETAQIAMEAALTGHLVLSTIHTNDSPTAVSRLAEMQVPTYLISSSVEAVLAQRLIRTLCAECKIPLDKLPPRLEEELKKMNIDPDEIELFTAKGCEKCLDIGYRGRSAIHELLVFDEDIRELLLTTISAGPIRDMAAKKGMRLLWEDGITKISRGITTLEEILRVSQ
ncbi:GspE/PulE family protein [Elusimicrobiota bacterium]